MNLAVLLTGACALQMPALQVPWKRAARSRQVEKSSTAVAGDTVLKHGLEVAMLKTVLTSAAVASSREVVHGRRRRHRPEARFRSGHAQNSTDICRGRVKSRSRPRPSPATPS